MHRLTFALATAALVACGSSSPPPNTPTPAPSALMPWLDGDHRLGPPAGGQLTWVGHRGARYGVWLGEGGRALVWIIDETSATDPTPRVWSVVLEPGAAPTVAALVAREWNDRALIASDATTTTTWSVSRDATGALAGAAGGLLWSTSELTAGDEAGEITALEILFAKDSLERGGAAWHDWFAADGAELTDAGLAVGREAVATAMGPFLAQTRLEWTPIAARAAADVAFAVGSFHTRTPQGQTLTGAGSYVTVWRKDPTDGWKVWFDGGRPSDIDSHGQWID